MSHFPPENLHMSAKIFVCNVLNLYNKKLKVSPNSMSQPVSLAFYSSNNNLYYCKASEQQMGCNRPQKVILFHCRGSPRLEDDLLCKTSTSRFIRTPLFFTILFKGTFNARRTKIKQIRDLTRFCHSLILILPIYLAGGIRRQKKL